jgi:hypothetical protein
VSAEECEIHTLEDALELLDEWEAAYRDLERAHMRLALRCADLEWLAEHNEFLRRHLDPFLPPSMQDAALRATDPKIYRSIAELVRGQWAAKRRSPFDEPA